MDTSSTRLLMEDPPPPTPSSHLGRTPSFKESITPVQYFSDFDPADEEDYDSAEEDFSFVFSAPRQSKSPDITADELFSEGQLLPLYPIFSKPSKEEEKYSTKDELEIYETASTSHLETRSDYCEWDQQSAPGSPCRKSRSTGSARKWIFHDFLAGARSQSDGKEKFVFLEKSGQSQGKTMAKAKAQVQAKVEKSVVKVEKRDGDCKKKEKKGKEVKEIDLATAHRLFYGMKGDKGKLKEGEKRKSFLPYFGFFGGGMNAFTKSSYPY